MGSFDTTVVNVAIEGITKGLHVKDSTQVAWVLSGYSIVYAATLLAAGRLGDWKGRKRVFTWGMSCFGLGSLLCGLAPTLWFLLAARVLQAAGAAMVTPASLALVLIAFPPAKRATAVGIWGAVGSLAGAVAPVLGSLINRALDWRGIFYINIPFVIVALIGGRRVMRESSDPSITKLPDLFGAVLVTGGVGLIVYAIIESSGWGVASTKFVLVLVAAAILIGVFFERCRTVADPVLDVGLLRERFFAVANLSAVLYTFSFFGIFLINVRFFFHVWHYSEYSAGIALTPIPVTASLAGVFSGRFVRRLGTRRTATLSALSLGGGLTLMVVLTGHRAAYWTHAAAPMTLIGFGVGSAIAVLNTSATIHLPAGRFSMGSAFISTGRQIGAAIGVALALALYSSVTKGADPLARAHLAWIVFAVAGVVAGLGLAVFYRPPRVDHHAAPAIVPDH
jgi:EmrB/QacA subfamily drug resistance transporter